MNANAAHALKPALLEPSASGSQPRSHGMHERIAIDERDIRVIVGGKLAQPAPLHARATSLSSCSRSHQDAFARLHLGMQGVSFNLNARERLVALGAGGLFAVVALTVALV